MVDKATFAVAEQCPVELLEAVGKTARRNFYYSALTNIGYYAPSHDGKIACLSCIQASLPRLIAGHNGRLITSEDEIKLALEKLVEAASDELGLELGAAHALPVKKIELAWHVKEDIKKIIMIQWHKRHPLIRRRAICHQDETLCYPGTNLKIKFYDKPREMGLPKECYHQITRIEVTLGNPEISRQLGTIYPFVAPHCFDRLYRAFREILMGFSSSNVPDIGSVVELLALLEHNGHRHGDISYFDLWARGKSRDHCRRVRKQMAAAHESLASAGAAEHESNSDSFVWGSVFPESGPPQAIQLEPVGITEPVL